MRRRRDIPADPVRTTAETLEYLRTLVAEALPAVDQDEIEAAFKALGPFASYLIPGEHLSETPITLLAGALACDFHTVHGEDAPGTEDPSAPPGGTKETSWELYVPVPAGAPFGSSDVESADPHLKPGPAPKGAGEAKASEAVSLFDLVNPGSLEEVRRG
jgi:hypothetical protein